MAPFLPHGCTEATTGAKEFGCKGLQQQCKHMCTSTHMDACVQPHILLLRRDLRFSRDLGAHPHERSYGPGTSASGPLLLLHSHTCERIHMDAHMGKGLQLQAHCCCCPAILRSTSTWTHTWARDFSFRPIAVVAQPHLGAHPHGRRYGQGTSASGPLLLLHSHTCERIHMDAHVGKGLQLQVHCCCSQP